MTVDNPNLKIPSGPASDEMSEDSVLGNLPPITPDPVMTMRRRHLPLLIGMVVVAVACVGTTGLYTGSQIVQTREDARAEQLRLDTQKELAALNAHHAAELARNDLALGTLATAVHDLDKKLGDRARVGDATLATARAALRTSRSNATKTDKIADDQTTLKQQVVDAAVTAHAVEKKVDAVASATVTVPAAKGHSWWGGVGH